MSRTLWRAALLALAAWHAAPISKAPAQQAPEATEAEVELTAEELRAQRDRLWEKAKRLRAEGKLVEAAASGEEMLAIERRWLGEDYEDIVISLEWLASLYAQARDWPTAESRWMDALSWRESHQGPAHWQSVDARLALADVQRLQRLSREEQEQLARALAAFRKSTQYYREGRYADAISLAKEVLVIRGKVLGEQHPDYAASVNNLATLCYLMGDYAQAEPLFRQASEIFKQALGEAHPDYAASLNNLAGLYQSMGDYARAEPLYRQALAIRKEALGEQHPDYANSLISLAALYCAMGDYARAEPLYLQASEIAKQVLGEQHSDYAASLNHLAALYRAMGDYARAEALYRQSLAIRKQVLGEQHPDYVTSLSGLALLYDSIGDYARAEPLLRQSLAIRKQVLGEQHPDYATSLNNLAELYHAMGDYARAEPLYRQALDIRKQVLGEQHPDYAQSLNNLAGLYYSMGDSARAEPLLRQASEIDKAALGEQHPDYATSLNNLAGLYRSTGDYARAEPLYRQASEIWKEALGEQHPDYAQSLNNLAGLYDSMGDYARAEPLYRQALDIEKQALGEQHPEYATSLNNLAGLYYSMGDYARAGPLCLQASEIAKQVLGEQHPDYAVSLNNLAALYRSMGDDARAEPLSREALAIVTALAEATAAAQDEAGQLRMGQSVQFYLDSYLSCLLKLGDDASAAYRAVLNWKGAVMVRQRAARLAAADPELAPIFTELQAVVRQWSTLAGGASPGGPEVRARIAELAHRKEQLERELSRRSAAFRAATEEVEVADLQTALPPGAVLVDYFEFWFSEPSAKKNGLLARRRSLAAFVVRPDGAVAMVDLGPMEPISAAIDAWRADFGASAPARDAGILLREKLWKPLEAALGDARLVLVSPDGALGKLPLAALPGQAPGTYLIEDVALALVPVPQLVPQLIHGAESPEFQRELLLVGGVDYDRRGAGQPPIDGSLLGDLLAVARIRGAARETAAGVQWPALPGTSGEVNAIEKLFRALRGGAADSVAVLTGAAATEENFRALAPRARGLHVATHGFFATPDKRSALVAVEEPDRMLGLSGQPEHGTPQGFAPGLLSGLVLAGANDPPELPSETGEFASLPEDGILTAEELAFLPLTGVQLVVLSACETGLGEAAGGEGLLGIQRAFQVAGARTTVATLWKVDDDKTQELMTAFYRNLLERQQSPLDALRNAQLEMLDELRAEAASRTTDRSSDRGVEAPADEAHASPASPYYWAAFTLSGDWR